MIKVDQRPRGGGRITVSIRKQDMDAFQEAADALEARTGKSVSQLIVDQLIAEYRRQQRKDQRAYDRDQTSG